MTKGQKALKGVQVIIPVDDSHFIRFLISLSKLISLLYIQQCELGKKGVPTSEPLFEANQVQVALSQRAALMCV